MNISFTGRRASAATSDDDFDVYEADAERLYDSFSDLYEDFDEGRSKTPFVIIGALLAVAIVGGGLAFAYKRGASEGTEGPAVILAERTATKVEPDEPGGIAIPHQDRQVFQEVAGQDTPAGDESADGDAGAALGDDPFAAAAPSPAPTGQAGFGAGRGGEPAASAADDGELTIGALASRLTSGEPDPFLAGNPVSGEPVPSPARSDPAAATPLAIPEPAGRAEPESLRLGATPTGGGALEPRRVQTVSIGPDGSVIREPAPASSGASEAETAARSLSSGIASPGAAAQTGTDIVAGRAAGQEGVDGVESLLRQSPDAAEPDAQQSLFTPSPRPKPRPTTRVAAAEPAESAAAAPARPQIPAPARNAAASATLEGFAVQVASHRQQAEAVAAFADLQQRYPNLISGYQPLIQRADLGERGIFYRLRIGPVADKGSADQLCASLKSAGLPGCLVRAL
jgi:cell division septation protein DedD